jgi:hypothetical protein
MSAKRREPIAEPQSRVGWRYVVGLEMRIEALEARNVVLEAEPA